MWDMLGIVHFHIIYCHEITCGKLVMRRLQSREDTPTTGSQTVTTIDVGEQEEEQVVLHLQVVPNTDERRVTWDEQVIDNENMGKKSSKGASLANHIL